MPVPVTQSLSALRAAADDGRLRAVCASFDIELLTLFGSALSSDNPSDIDVAVGFAHGAERDLIGAVGALSDLVPGDHLDIMDLDRAGPVARVEGLVGAQILHESAAGAFSRRELAALGEYLDTAYLRQALLRELAR